MDDDLSPPAVRLARDPSAASAERAYNYAAGGKDHFLPDREAADEIREMSPDAARSALDNRDFLSRAVWYVAQRGVTQFLDIGSGRPLPGGNAHQWAAGVGSATRTVYVDNDPSVVRSLQAQVEFVPEVRAMHGDLADPRGIMTSPLLAQTLDLRQPVAVILGAVLHFLGDSTAFDAVEYVKRGIAPGSHLIISHATGDGAEPADLQRVLAGYARMRTPLTLREERGVARFFGGWQLVGPGIVNVTAWRNPVEVKSQLILYGAAGRKPYP